MSEYVKKDDVLLLAECELSDDGCESFVIYPSDVARLPAADVAEVVRCKDCKFWGSTLTPEEIEEARTDPNSDLVCDMWMSDGFSLDDYCSCGKRRSDGN